MSLQYRPTASGGYGKQPTVVYSTGYQSPATYATPRAVYAAPTVSYKAPATYAAQQYTPRTANLSSKYTTPVVQDVQIGAMKASPRFQDFTLADLDDNEKTMSMFLGKPTLILNCATL